VKRIYTLIRALKATDEILEELTKIAKDYAK
jgi:hypothetical protein